MPHVSETQLITTGAGAVTILSLAATWYHAPGIMAEGGYYAVLGAFMSSFATLVLLLTLATLGSYIVMVVLFAVLQRLRAPIVDDVVDWFDRRAVPDWTNGYTQNPKGHTWRVLFGESRLDMVCGFAELAIRPIAALLIYLLLIF